LIKRVGKTNAGDHFFIVGLLHDIGKVALEAFFPELFLRALEETRDNGEAGIHVAESRVIGVDHGEMGAMLLTRWRFPESISDPICVHHHIELPEGVDSFDVAIVKIADALVQELAIGETGNPEPSAILEIDLSRLGIGDKELQDVKASLRDAEDGIYAFFDALN
jgi:putative nucleotidyltransferase with HDIG domain